VKNNPWQSRFDHDLSDREIDKRVVVMAQPISGLDGDPSEIAAIRLREAMSAIYIPTCQQREVLRKLYLVARGHAMVEYTDVECFMRRLYQGPRDSDAKAICMTGLAGVGKTQLFHALARIFGEPESIDIAGLKGLPLKAMWSLTLRSGLGVSDLLQPFVEDPFPCGTEKQESLAARRPRTSSTASLRVARARAYRDGVCLLGLDELQFVTQSLSANSRATSLLLLMNSIGPKLIFSANLSMMHRLKTRSQEERQRLLADLIVLLPDRADSPELLVYLGELFRVSPDTFPSTAKEVVGQIYSYTFGVRRTIVKLLTLAYLVARKAGRKKITSADFETAYRSLEFSADREDVLILISQDIQNKAIRKDLWCPFEIPATSNVSPLTSAIDNFNNEVEQKMLASSLTPSEKAAAGASDAPKREGRNSTVVSMRAGRATKEALLKGAKAFEKQKFE